MDSRKTYAFQQVGKGQTWLCEKFVENRRSSILGNWARLKKYEERIYR